MAEATETQATQETRNIVERIGEKKAQAIAALGVAAAVILGSGRPNMGVGVGIEVPNPATGEPVMVGLSLSSSEEYYPLGIPNIPGKDYKDFEAYTVMVGGAKIAVIVGNLEKGDIPVFPEFAS